MEIRLEMIVGIRNKCSSEMRLYNNDNNKKERMAELISNSKKIEIIIMKQVCK